MADLGEAGRVEGGVAETAPVIEPDAKIAPGDKSLPARRPGPTFIMTVSPHREEAGHVEARPRSRRARRLVPRPDAGPRRPAARRGREGARREGEQGDRPRRAVPQVGTHPEQSV